MNNRFELRLNPQGAQSFDALVDVREEMYDYNSKIVGIDARTHTLQIHPTKQTEEEIRQLFEEKLPGVLAA